MSDRMNLSFTVRVKILEFLKEVCKTNALGEALYNEGWNDRTVADYFSVNESNVRGIRHECFGPIAKVAKQTPAQRIEELEQKWEELLPQIERRLTNLECYIKQG